MHARVISVLRFSCPCSILEEYALHCGRATLAARAELHIASAACLHAAMSPILPQYHPPGHLQPYNTASPTFSGYPSVLDTPSPTIGPTQPPSPSELFYDARAQPAGLPFRPSSSTHSASSTPALGSSSSSLSNSLGLHVCRASSNCTSSSHHHR